MGAVLWKDAPPTDFYVLHIFEAKFLVGSYVRGPVLYEAFCVGRANVELCSAAV